LVQGDGMKKFFCGVDFKELIPYAGDVLMNYGTIRRKKIKIVPSLHTFFLDSGGFTEIFRFGKYTFSSAEYYEYILNHDIDHFATMDYPCEPIVLQKTGKTVNEHIVMTVESNLDLMDCAGVVPVIQGYAVDDYIYCCDLINDYGGEKPLMAIGTMCKRTKVADAIAILQAVSKEFPHSQFHAFGLKKNFLPKVKDMIYSSDSIAWFYFQRGGFPKKIPAMQKYAADIRTKYCDGAV
jgi:hypothetical protein